MGYSDALIGYLNAYNAKAKLEADPILEPGVMANEQDKITGQINLSQVMNYDMALNEIENVIPNKIDNLQSVMDSYAPKIFELFTMGTIDVTMNTGQKITVTEGVIHVYTPE